jgi:MFS family permease
MNTSIIAGSVIGIFAAAFLAEWLGRKNTMIMALSQGVIGVLICIFSVNENMAIIGLFFYGSGLDIAYSSIFSLVT